MIDYRSYMDRIQRAMSESHAPDVIDEQSWLDIVIRDLQNFGGLYESNTVRDRNKILQSFRRDQDYFQASPTRLLGLVLPVIAWLGWVMHENRFDEFTWQKISEAFSYGKNLSVTNQFE